MSATEWQPTACILCECNCGIEVQLDGRHFARIRGDKAHPASQGYTCNKAMRLDHYQNGRDRLTTPLRRRDPGGAGAGHVTGAGGTPDGHVSLPNGMGLDAPGEDGEIERVGVAANELTATAWRDPVAGTPWHKHVPARVEALA